MMLILGDAIAVTLIKMRGFNKSHFGNFHPGGNIGKDLVQLLQNFNYDGYHYNPELSQADKWVFSRG